VRVPQLPDAPHKNAYTVGKEKSTAALTTTVFVKENTSYC